MLIEILVNYCGGKIVSLQCYTPLGFLCPLYPVDWLTMGPHVCVWRLLVSIVCIQFAFEWAQSNVPRHKLCNSICMCKGLDWIASCLFTAVAEPASTISWHLQSKHSGSLNQAQFKLRANTYQSWTRWIFTYKKTIWRMLNRSIVIKWLTYCNLFSKQA